MIQQCPCVCSSRCADGVVHPLPVLTPLNHAGIAQYFHVVGESRLRNPQLFQELASTLFPRAEHFQNPQPIFIAEPFEHMNHIRHGGEIVSIYRKMSMFFRKSFPSFSCALWDRRDETKITGTEMGRFVIIQSLKRTTEKKGPQGDCRRDASHCFRYSSSFLRGSSTCCRNFIGF